MKVREPVARPVDVVAVELLLSASQAFLAGVMMYLAVGIWDDRGVGIGPVAIILGLLGVAVGGAWLYWLLGGTGWPLAAANVPTAMFLGFALILGWQGDGLIRLDTLPLLMALAASIFGAVAGVFLDSPRRWRWDQRQKLRPGTEVPLVSPATMGVMARVPRSLPTRPSSSVEPDATGALAALDPPSASTTGGSEAKGSDDTSVPYLDGTAPPASEVPGEPAATPDADGEAADEPSATRSFSARIDPIDPIPTKPRDDGPDAAASDSVDADATDADAKADDPIELPTSIEPKAQRSPWAWAAPPEWNRDDEEDLPRGGSPSGS